MMPLLNHVEIELFRKGQYSIPYDVDYEEEISSTISEEVSQKFSEKIPRLVNTNRECYLAEGEENG